METTTKHYKAVVIGSGFGGTMTALSLAREFMRRGKGEKLLMLERGTWWTTPVGTVQDKEVKAADFLRSKAQPVQYWSSVEHFRGFIDIFLRCVRRKKNEDGLYDLTTFGRRGFLGLGSKNDGVSIVRANGVGGGSLVYANVTIQPPDLIFDDPRWPVKWDNKRNSYFDLARKAIGRGVLFALNEYDATLTPPKPPVPPGAKPVNTGLSNIVTRSAALNPQWLKRDDPNNKRKIRYIDPAKSTALDHANDVWIDRARVFQSEMGKLTNDYGTVDSSINDIDPEGNPLAPSPNPANYCERQGRCIVGCLPGARHTLNKQLMVAVLGKPNRFDKPDDLPLFPDMSLEPLAEVDVIKARAGGGYEVHYFQRDADDPSHTTKKVVTADKVIVSAGCVGTNEIMLRSKDRGTLPNLSDKAGFGFSTNGDYLAFLEGTTERVSLTRGPITTSFGHFNTPAAGPGADPAKFHTIEDNGIPRALSTLIGQGIPLLRSLAGGRSPRLVVFLALLRWLWQRLFHYVRAFFVNYRERQDVFQSEDEHTMNMMCIAAMGREASVGQFRLGKGRRDSPLRVERADGKQFFEDPIYKTIRESLASFAEKLTGTKDRSFINPFLTETADALGAKAIGLTHPLGGCIMATSAADGTVDEYGRVFDKTKDGGRGFCEGLYLADASVIPTALGVNPSLTISALALRTAEKIVAEL